MRPFPDPPSYTDSFTFGVFSVLISRSMVGGLPNNFAFSTFPNLTERLLLETIQSELGDRVQLCGSLLGLKPVEQNRSVLSQNELPVVSSWQARALLLKKVFFFFFF